MRRALDLARKAAAEGEVPVGCIIVQAGAIIAEGRNARERGPDPTAHAEIEALRKAARLMGTWRLDGADLYVTCEPCPMCAGALVLARVKHVYFGCPDPKGGGVTSRYGIGIDGELNHTFEVTGGVLGDDCAAILREFFASRRA